MNALLRLLARVRRELNLRMGVDIVRVLPDPSRFEPHDELRWLSHLRIQTVIDVGAHEGEFIKWIRRGLPRATIVAIEPLQDCYEKLVLMAARDSNLTAIHSAVGATRGHLTIHHNAYSMSSSLREMTDAHRTAFPFTAVVDADTVVLVQPLDEIIDASLATPILLKIDVQGFEREVLSGATAVLARVDTVIVEVSFVELYQGQALFHEITESLRASGFRYSGNLWQLRDPRDGGVLQADAVFVRGAVPAPAETVN